MITEARNLKVGDKFKSGKTIQEVISIVEVNNKVIHFKHTRVFPDNYGPFTSYKGLNTLIELI